MGDVSVVANAADMIEYTCRQWINEVFIYIPESEPYPIELTEQFMRMGVAVHVALARMSAISRKKQLVERLGGYAVITTAINYATPAQLFVKRWMDIAGGLAGYLITGLLFLCLALVIHLQSSGPIFFSQICVGKGGRQKAGNCVKSMRIKQCP